MRQAVGLHGVSSGPHPGLRPWAGMNQTFGLEGLVWYGTLR